MKTNHVRAKLKHGDPSIGTWLTLPDPIAASMMARVGFDWLTVELEHSPTSFETAAIDFAIISANGTVPLARVPWNSVENIKRVLDTGAWGVVVPMVNSRAEAEAAVAAARYAPAPHGCRTIGGQLHAVNFQCEPGTYYSKANEEILVVLMAEHVKAIENADEIFSLPGIDAVFIGPNDLHHSMGRAPAFESDHKEFTDAIDHILKIARKHKIAAGIHVVDEAAAQRRLQQGFQFIAIGSEAGMMLSKAQEIARAVGLGGKSTVAKY
jgi:4-hydroxy-2-oxoheptanedioate aldolase